MTFLPSPPRCLGVERCSSGFRLAELKETRDGWKIVRLEELEDVGKLDTALHTLSAVPSRDVLVRSCEIQLKKERDLFDALDFQVEPLLPYPADQALIQAQVIERKEKGTLLTAFALRKEHLEKHLEDLPFEPEYVTCVPFALASFSTLFPQTKTPNFLVHIGEEEVSCAFVQEGKLLASRAFERDEHLVREVQKTVLSFSAAHKTKPFQSLFLLGESTYAEEIQEATEKLVLFPTAPELSLSQEELIRYGLTIGIALSRHGPNFRQKEFAYPHPWRRVKRPLLTGAALSILLAATAYFFGNHICEEKRDQISHDYLSLCLQEEIEGKALKTPEIYLSTLEEVQKEIQTRPETHPLYPQIPLVREVMSWLTTLPEVVLTDFHYTMEKFPTLENKRAPYRVKVELQLSADNPQEARAFQEALNAPNPFIDTKEKVKWSTARGKYQATFYLKDQTRYR